MNGIDRTNRPWGRTLGSLLLLTALAACGFSAFSIGADASQTKAEAAKPEAKTAKTDVLAMVQNQPITVADVEAAASAQLSQLEKQRHEILEKTLETVIDEKLFELEAQKRGVTKEQLLAQEVEAKVTAPTDAEIDAFYEEKKAMIRQPKEQIVDRIKQYLQQTKSQETYANFIGGLKSQYGVKNLMEPYRIPVEAGTSPAKGPADAPVLIVEFSDFECPFCSRVVPALDQVKANYGDKVRLVFRQFPLTNIHPNAQKAAEAALCANEQGKFWEMHDKLFADQKALGVDQLKAKAVELALNAESFNACLDNGKQAAAVQSDLEAGSRAGVTGTPAMFINGRFLNGAVPYEQVAKVIDEELARKGIAVPAAAATAAATAPSTVKVQ